jgi:cyd operon protein YbgT
MWYFAWVLGLGFAVLLAILNAMWGEAQEDKATIALRDDDQAGRPR